VDFCIRGEEQSHEKHNGFNRNTMERAASNMNNITQDEEEESP